MKYIHQRIELADGTKCVALEDYDKLATENMLEVNKLCNQRDAAMDVLSDISRLLNCELCDENTTAKEYGARIRVKYEIEELTNMMQFHKLCNQRDAAMDVLSKVSHFLSCGIGDENTTAKEFGERIIDGFVDLSNRLGGERDLAEAEKTNLIKELKEAWLAMDEIEGTDRINEWQNKNAHFLGIDNMSPELIKITKKVDSFREVLKQNGFEILQCFWYSDGRYCGNWKDMSIAKEKPDIEEALTFWQFSFRSQNEKNKRIHLEALMPVFEDYFTFDLRYYPEVKLHDREGYSGPTAKLEVCGILEEDLIYLQKHIDYLLNLK